MKTKRLALLLPVLFVCVFAFAQVKPKPPTSSGGSGVADGGAPMFSAATVVGALTVGSIVVDGGISDPVGTMVLTTSAADGGTGVTLNNNVAISSGTLLSVQNNSAEKFSVSAAGNVYAPAIIVDGGTTANAITTNIDSGGKYIINSSGHYYGRLGSYPHWFSGNVYVDAAAFGTSAAFINNDAAVTFGLSANVADGASAVALALNNSVAFSTTGSKLLSIRNNSSEKAYYNHLGGGFFGVGSTSGNMLTIPEGTGITIDNGTTVFATQDTSTHTVTLKSGVTNSNNRVAYIFDTTNNLTNSGTMIAQFKLAGTTKFAIDKFGNITTVNNVTATGDISGSYITASNDLQAPSGSVIGDTVNAYTTLSTDGTLQDNNKVIDTTAGDSATANSFAFRFRKDNSGASFAVTSDKVTANSVPACNIMSAASGVTIDSVVPTSGTLTINFSAAPAGNVDVNCIVIN